MVRVRPLEKKMLWFAYGPFSVVDEENRSHLEDDRALLRGFGYSMVKNLPVLREMKGGFLFGYAKDDVEEERLQFKYRVLYGTHVVCKDVKIELLRTKKIVKAKLFYVPCTLGPSRSGDVLLDMKTTDEKMDKFAAFQLSTQFFGRVANPSLSSKFKDYLFGFKSKIRSTDLLDALYFLIFQNESFEKTYDEFAHSRFLDNFVHFLRTDSFDDEEDYEDENFATGDPFNTNDPYHDLSFVRDGSKKSELPSSIRVVSPQNILLGPHPALCQDSTWNIKQVIYTLIHCFDVRIFCHVDDYLPFDFEALAREAWTHRYGTDEAEDAPLMFLQYNVLDGGSHQGLLRTLSKKDVVKYIYVGVDEEEDLNEVHKFLMKREDI